MANFYVYLISSLPMLQFGMKPPFSFERFLAMCSQFIPEEDLVVLNALPHPEDYLKAPPAHPFIGKWIEFDATLRNELVKVRAARKHIEPAKYLSPPGHDGHALASLALTAQRNPSLTEAEKIIDEARWKALDDLAVGHYFDFEYLAAYAYKLLILERWEKMRLSDKAGLLKQALQN
jgi:hypothetical protein